MTNKQLEKIGFRLEPKGRLALRLEEDGNIYATFWKNGEKLYVDALDQPKEKEFIYLEHLSVKGLELLIQRTSKRLRKWKNNNDHIKKLLNGTDSK